MGSTVTKRKPETLAELLEEYRTIKGEAKALYGRSDLLLTKLVKRIRRNGGEERLDEHHKAVVINNWAGKDKVYAGGFSRHYEIEVIDA